MPELRLGVVRLRLARPSLEGMLKRKTDRLRQDRTRIDPPANEP
jgi:hypothetical protein